MLFLVIYDHLLQHLRSLTVCQFWFAIRDQWLKTGTGHPMLIQ